MDKNDIDSLIPEEIQKLTLSNHSSTMPQKSESSALIASMEAKLDQAEDTVSSTLVSNTINQSDNAPLKNQDKKTTDEMIVRIQEEDDKFNDGEPSSAEQNGAILGFRKSILDYIKDAANPKLSLKLMKASKDFCFNQFPYFPIKRLQISDNDERNGIEWFYEKLDKEFGDGDGSNFDAIPHKLWITKKLNICDYSNGLLQIIPKIAVFDLKKMYLTFLNIFFDDFSKFMSLGSTKYLRLWGVKMTFENGDVVPFDKIIETLTNVESLSFECDIPPFSAQAIQNLSSVRVPANLNEISLEVERATFDLDVFEKFIACHPKVRFIIQFDDDHSHYYEYWGQNGINKLRHAHQMIPVFVDLPID
uniref:Uncharacterized protein n=1 Tax=Panagrolaimus sp. ES5 TaxID=591445 RepID=A0AC34GUU6_9BILA